MSIQKYLKNASLCVNGWRPNWALLQWKERDFPPIRVMFVRYVSLFRGRAVGRLKNTGGRQVAIQGLLDFIYSEKATKFCKNFTLLLSYVVPVKSKVKISHNFVALLKWFVGLWVCGEFQSVFSTKCQLLNVLKLGFKKRYSDLIRTVKKLFGDLFYFCCRFEEEDTKKY